ncbi:hypothetical protein BpHYR1_048825 [Brachionus plicatilis]|uniref:Uncharacterized protein n=1 Tax=Brachionus plicatilis TaxID=10195 RepID=A0A3M7Q318_BRAPC|nr:hypothetical protein BpHYR1_048825 [Brachionus plicatilis]
MLYTFQLSQVEIFFCALVLSVVVLRMLRVSYSVTNVKKQLSYRCMRLLAFFFWRNLIIVYFLIQTAWVLELKSVAISFQGLPERLRSEKEPVSSYRFLVEETHFGDTPNNLTFSFSFLSLLFSRPTIYHFCGLDTFFSPIFCQIKNFLRPSEELEKLIIKIISCFQQHLVIMKS